LSEPKNQTEDLAAAVRRAARQEQFLEVVDRDEAVARFHRHLTLAPLGKESVALGEARGRVLAEDVVASVDVPGFDRSNVDGFAVRALDTAGASDPEPRALRLNPEILTPGVEPRLPVAPGTATVIATGGMLPRGADAVLMVEHTEFDEAAGTILVLRPAVAGQLVAFAGSDMARGETVLRRGKVVSARETGMLAAVGRGTVEVWRKPRVAVLSTGDELVPPGATLRPGAVYDSNAAVVAATIEELGGLPVPLGIVADDEAELERRLQEGLEGADLVVLSGGTSKGAGDVAHRVVARLGAPGILVHGVALKPGKPICLAVVGTKPVVVLPGFPTSAMFTFQEFVAPVIRAFAGRPPDPAETTAAVLATRLPSERGRMEYVMASLVAAPGEGGGLVAYPTAKGSGAVTAFAQADGFFSIPPLADSVPAGTPVSVQRLGASARPADLVVIGSHCLGLEHLLGCLEDEGVGLKALYVGSTGGLAAARRGECDVAGVHLLDPDSGVYNTPFLTPALELVPGWRRMQGIVFRHDDTRFAGASSAAAALPRAIADEHCAMVNRNAGSGTRILVDRLLAGARPAGYFAQPKSHNAVAAAVAQGRADWGVAIGAVAQLYGLGFLPLVVEHYDLVVPRARLDRPPVQRLLKLLSSASHREALHRLGFESASSTPEDVDNAI
jgi:putative molybdopterin biosynthesis protein